MVFSGQQVLAAQALASGQVVVALADGAVDLLARKATGLRWPRSCRRRGAFPPPECDRRGEQAQRAVQRPGQQPGSDTIFVFAQVEGTEEGGGVLPGAVDAGAQPLRHRRFRRATAAANSRLRPARLRRARRDSDQREYVGIDEHGFGVATATTTIGLSLGTFSSLGNGSAPGNADTVLVPVEGNTYQSVPILEFGFGTEGDEASPHALALGQVQLRRHVGLDPLRDRLDEALEDIVGLMIRLFPSAAARLKTYGMKIFSIII